MQKETTQPMIDEMNEVIGRFEGGERIPHPDQVHFSEPHYGYICHKGHWWNEKNLQYHSSWDWLMPVVEKIYDTLADMLKKRPPHTAVEDDLIEVDIHCAVREVDILKAHGFVYQFITWYNQNKTNEQ